MRLSTCLVAVLSAATGLAGCSTVTLKPRSLQCTLATLISTAAACEPMARMSDEKDAEAKQFAPSADKINIYVVRPSILGGRYEWTILVDGRPVGRIAEHTYLLLQVEPGSHEIAVQTGENRHAIVAAGGGDVHFVEVIARLGTVEARAELRAVSREQGEKSVRDSKRVDLLAN